MAVLKAPHPECRRLSSRLLRPTYNTNSAFREMSVSEVMTFTVAETFSRSLFDSHYPSGPSDFKYAFVTPIVMEQDVFHPVRFPTGRFPTSFGRFPTHGI
jgi:hypothetical protein